MFNLILIICFIFGFFLYPAYNYSKQFKYFEIFFVIIFFTFVYLRPSTLPDYEAYIDFYNHLHFSDFIFDNGLNSFYNYEFGFFGLMHISKSVGLDFRMFSLLLTVINISIIYQASKRIFKKQFLYGDVKFFLPFFLIYISYFGFLYNLIVLRAGISITLVFFSLSLFIDRKYFFSILVLFISVFFHRSALVGVIVFSFFYFIPVLSRKSYYVFWFFLLALYILRVDISVLNIDVNLILGLSDSKIDNLFGSYLAKGFNVSRYSFRILLYLLSIPFIIKSCDRNNTFSKLLNIFMLGIFLQILFQGFAAFTRVSDYFTFYSVILYSYIVFSRKTKLEKFVSLLLFVVFQFVLFYRVGLI